MPFSEKIAVYSENHTKPIDTLYGQNAELLIFKQVVYKVPLGFEGLRE
jgi:hypothetical protein